ncbi:uncharacterized protein SCHCODRAFT_02669241 [Schizophyllum commune H4-8]|nr:uncharacterized protein SCHCODRAFT_02669241 [Schizophyllum commune H4-8]KAI5890033.1 hypothetical protein SCHCODRAFT_02669241 [Schizophyllum commune H4-8]
MENYPTSQFLQTEFADDEALVAVSAPSANALLERQYPPTRLCRMAARYLYGACLHMLPFPPTPMSTSMADSDRSPSVQSFASADSMSVPATSVPASPVASSTILHHEDMPRVITAMPDSADHEFPQNHRFCLKDGNTKFELDDGSIYNVHRYFFETHALKFAEEYLDGEALGPIKLSGVCNVDFERFLSMIYPTTLGKFDITTVDEWTSILRLATRWAVVGLRDLAIEEIKPKATPFDKVVIAREFELGQDWLLPAFVDICERPQWLNRVEAERLGLPTVVEIGRIREDARISGPTFDVHAAVRATEILVPRGREGAQHIDDVPQATSTTASSTLAGAASATDALALSDVASLVSSPPASSAPQTPQEPTPDSLPSENLSPADQLAYDALRSAEFAEEASFPSTPLNRALFASHLARRMAHESSPGAQRHREWRQARVDNIIREVADAQGPVATPDEMKISRIDDDPLGMLHSRLAYLLCAKLATCGSIPWPHAGCGDKLTVSTSSYHSLSFDLARRGWVVGNFPPGINSKSSLGKFYVAIPNWDEDIPKYMIVFSSESAHPDNGFCISKKRCILARFHPTFTKGPSRAKARSRAVPSTPLPHGGAQLGRRLSAHVLFPLNLHGQPDSLTLDDGTLYNVHRYFFETYAPNFPYEYLYNEGFAPIKLPGVSSVDFQRFLTIIYPTKLGKYDIKTVDEWTSVLRLATKWSIESLRTLAAEEIVPQASPFDKVSVAREFELGRDWLVPAFVDICARPQWLNCAEAERLGLPTVVEIGRIREEVRTSGPTFDVHAAIRASEILAPGGREEAQSIGDIPQVTSTTASSTSKVSVSAPNISLAAHVPSPVSSPPPSSLDSVPSESLSPADQLAYDALRIAEVAEEDSFDDMPLNRALFASHLARRLTDQKSPSALRHGEWRQSRVDEIAREVIGSVRPPEEPHYLNVTSPDAYRALSTVQERLSYLLAAKLPVRGSAPRPVREDKLTVSSMSWKAYDHITFELRREGWIVGGALGKNGHGRIYIAIPNRDEDIPKYTI